MEITLKAQPRSERGKGAARRARASARIPGILYGPAIEPVALVVDVRDMHQALQTEAGHNVLINLRLDSKTKYLTMLREVQRDPIRGDLIHVDFVNVARDVKIHAGVPVQLVGESRGLKEGGVVEHHLWEIAIQALPTEVPRAFEVDISRLGIGDHVRVAEIRVPAGVDLLTDPDEIIAAVVEPQVLRLPEEEAAAEAAAAAEAEAAAAAEEGGVETAAPEEPAAQ